MKLTHDQVREIRKQLERGDSQLTIAKKFNTSQMTISRIKLGRTYVAVFDKEITSFEG